MQTQPNWQEAIDLGSIQCGFESHRLYHGFESLHPSTQKLSTGANTVVLETGTRLLEFKATAALKQFIGFKQGNAASPGYSTYTSPQLRWIEHRISNPLVRGSNPFGGTIYEFSSVGQSIWLRTSRSGVRISQLVPCGLIQVRFRCIYKAFAPLIYNG